MHTSIISRRSELEEVADPLSHIHIRGEGADGRGVPRRGRSKMDVCRDP